MTTIGRILETMEILMTYGGNFYEDWQNSHVLGVDYYENKNTPGGSVIFGAHNTQHITANRKGYAMWWILARIAGWDGIIHIPVTSINVTSAGGCDRGFDGELLAVFSGGLTGRSNKQRYHLECNEPDRFGNHHPGWITDCHISGYSKCCSYSSGWYQE